MLRLSWGRGTVRWWRTGAQVSGYGGWRKELSCHVEMREKGPGWRGGTSSVFDKLRNASARSGGKQCCLEGSRDTRALAGHTRSGASGSGSVSRWQRWQRVACTRWRREMLTSGPGQIFKFKLNPNWIQFDSLQILSSKLSKLWRKFLIDVRNNFDYWKFPIFEFKFELKFMKAKVVLNFRDLIKIPTDFEN
jgi:hypothetical protein